MLFSWGQNVRGVNLTTHFHLLPMLKMRGAVSPLSHRSSWRGAELSTRIILFFIHQWLYSPLLGPGLFFSFLIFFTQTVGLLGRVISPAQGRYLHIGQHKDRINAHTNIYVLSEIRPTIRDFEQAKAIHTLDRAATVIGQLYFYPSQLQTPMRNFTEIHLLG
jgi:hypothetical protein